MKIQTQVIPLALQGKEDVFAISPPRSGKFGAFLLPILHTLLETGPNLNTFFACVLSPKWELACQIAEGFTGLGSRFGVKCATLAESFDMANQAYQISQQPHIIVATPGEILNNLRHTQGFSLALGRLKYLVIDDAHLLLNDHSEQQLCDISEMIPTERTTYLFSSTLTEKVHTIQSVCLRNPVKCNIFHPEGCIILSIFHGKELSSIVDTLRQQRCSMQASHKDCYLAYTLSEMMGRKSMVCTNSCGTTLLLALILKNLGFRAVPIIIFMTQEKKRESLNAFKSGEYSILLCSDEASRGLDIPAVDMDYMYRVGWTTHADAAIFFVSPREVRQFNMIERHIGIALPVYPAPSEDVLLLGRRVREAEKFAQKEMKEFGWKSGGYLDQQEVDKMQWIGQRIM
ncbi:RNA helicase [Trifolium repens]|nr:RNA helicase [Trifolium repens]